MVLDSERSTMQETALLDQINCYSSYAYHTEGQYRQCGEPLNFTGVWKP